jgi:large subunit ribosomal protein L25
VLTGPQPRGVKEGGILQHPTRELAIECLPMQMPEHIEVDASGLGIGGSIHLADLKLPEGVKHLADPEQVVVMVAAPVSAEKLESMLSAEAAGEVKEPELVSKGKEEEAAGKE